MGQSGLNNLGRMTIEEAACLIVEGKTANVMRRETSLTCLGTESERHHVRL